MVVDAYALLKFVHVSAAIFLVGTIPLEYLLVTRARKRDDRAFLARLIPELEWIENRIAVPSALALLASGLLMVFGPLGRWPFWDPPTRFAAIGLVLWVGLVVSFAVLVTARYKKIHAWASGETEAAPPWSSWKAWFLTGTTLAVVAVFEMVTKAV